MSEVSNAYNLATHIHDSFWLRNANLTPQEVMQCRTYTSISDTPGKTEQVTASGRGAAEPRYETLSKTKDGTFYLSAAYGPEYGTGQQPNDLLRITPESSELDLMRLASSLFIKSLVDIASARDA